jgi:hypothetical protein
VASQYCGALGKTDNCQASVVLGYASDKGYGLLDYELFLPEKWHSDDYAWKRKKCRVPEGLEFRTKSEILLSMIHKTVDSGLFKGKYIGVDSFFGRDHKFLDALPRNYVYFADIPCNTRVFIGRPVMALPEYKGRGRRPSELVPSFPARSVNEIADDDDFPWNDVVLGNGAKGPVVAKDKCIKVVEFRDGKPGKDVWLYMRMLEDNSIKYALCNESMDATFEEVRTPVLRRWSIEQCFEECKNELGMDHYEVRSWCGWRRHMLLTFIAHLFILKMRLKFSILNTQIGPGPYVEKPVPLKEYVEAALKIRNEEELKHPKLHGVPPHIRYTPTVGFMRKIINGLIPKVGKLINSLDHDAANYANSYNSHTKTKIDHLIHAQGTIPAS